MEQSKQCPNLTIASAKVGLIPTSTVENEAAVRTDVVEAVDRKITVEGTDRKVAVKAADRTVNLEAEIRTVTVGNNK